MFQETSLYIGYTLLLAKKCIKILSCNASPPILTKLTKYTSLENKKSNKSLVTVIVYLHNSSLYPVATIKI